MIYIKKSIKNLILVFPVLLFLTVYAVIPNEINVTAGQSLSFNGMISGKAPTDNIGRFDCRVRFLGMPIKTVNVSVNPERYVIPSGQAIGVKIYTDGVLVVGMGSVTGDDGILREPAKTAGLEIGDRITEINNKKIISTEDFTDSINKCKGNALLKVIRKDSPLFIKIQGIYSEKFNDYKLGLWVRDSTAGIGTLTFYNPDNMTFAALGHGICDSNTGDLLVAERGSINECKVVNVIKGKKGSTGELMGTFLPCIVGDIVTNCSVGVLGKTRTLPQNNPVKVMPKNVVREGKAIVLCDIDGNGISSYEIEITKLSVNSSESNKDFVIKVTDKTLIEKTGGIVQGMSGSPIMQDGMLAGAVTHVFVNNAAKGYGIFAETMLSETEKIPK